jgi:secreted trypsin-like serine protease
MLSLLLLAVLPLAYAASVNPEGRIVNGANVNIANYPWQVSANSTLQ